MIYRLTDDAADLWLQVLLDLVDADKAALVNDATQPGQHQKATKPKSRRKAPVKKPTTKRKDDNHDC